MTRQKGVVFGGCGFIGVHCTARLLREGCVTYCVDNLSRPGASANLEWLQQCAAPASNGELVFLHADVRDAAAVDDVFAQAAGVDIVLHQAAQVAVTTSVQDPRTDFETNALGTLNVLESLRHLAPGALLIFSSTNKVYGESEQLAVVEDARRYRYADLPEGVSESQPLDFHSPYGCSKGAADQYVRDYARIYGLDTVVFRQSCIYGTHQYGMEDQGWVAWFIIAAVLGKEVTIFGNGKQIRDLLWIDDLLDAYWAAWARRDAVSGRIFNMGGGPQRTLSLLELVEAIARHSGIKIQPALADWRPGDQKVYVSDIARARQELQWEPQVCPDEGVKRLLDWVRENADMLRSLLGS